MLRFSTQFIKMHLLPLVMILPVFMVVNAATPPCDPDTQYELYGQCCLMCGPGTYMMSQSTCDEPQCVNCGKNEYQDSHTTEYKCKLQPYCDPNRNFKPVDFDEKSKTERYSCQCAEGFHCTGEGCTLVCLPHKTCKPGERIQYKGNQTHDRVCQKCPEGTFIESSEGDCKKWKECERGYHIVMNGTISSDNVCAANSRLHLPVIGVSIALVALAALASLAVWLFRGKRAAKEKVKLCDEACAEVERLPHKEDPLITFPTPDPISDVPHTTILLPTEDIGSVPEENELQPSQTENGYTDNGNVVRQENGKSYIFPRQESQTQTLSHESSFCSDM